MMKILMSVCKPIQPTVSITGAGGLDLRLLRSRPQKEKVVVVMGATGCGKSRLSVDLATRFPAEIVNSDKMQLYEGLEIVTNKITEEEQCGVPHHLLGVVDPNDDFTADHFRVEASFTADKITKSGQLPIIVGGSNSYIEELIDGEGCEFRSKYDCCFLWVDVALPVLRSFISNRVDRMVQAGMVEEVRSVFDPEANYSRGIRRAIGVPELHRYFKSESDSDEETRVGLLEEAIEEIKVNTCELARRQLEKIYRLRNIKGWEVHRLNATDVFLKRGLEADVTWEDQVAGPGARIVGKFLYDLSPRLYSDAAAAAAIGTAVASSYKPLQRDLRLSPV